MSERRRLAVGAGRVPDSDRDIVRLTSGDVRLFSLFARYTSNLQEVTGAWEEARLSVLREVSGIDGRLRKVEQQLGRPDYVHPQLKQEVGRVADVDAWRSIRERLDDLICAVDAEDEIHVRAAIVSIKSSLRRIRGESGQNKYTRFAVGYLFDALAFTDSASIDAAMIERFAAAARAAEEQQIADGPALRRARRSLESAGFDLFPG